MKLKDFEKIALTKEAIIGAAVKGIGSYIAKNPLKSLGAGFIGTETIGSGIRAGKRLPRMKSQAKYVPDYKYGLE